MEISYTNPALTTKVTNDLINRCGIHMTEGNLTAMRRLGTGPAYFRFGKKPLYTVDSVRDWIEKRLQMPVQEAVRRGLIQLPPGAVLNDEQRAS